MADGPWQEASKHRHEGQAYERAAGEEVQAGKGDGGKGQGHLVFQGREYWEASRTNREQYGTQNQSRFKLRKKEAKGVSEEPGASEFSLVATNWTSRRENKQQQADASNGEHARSEGKLAINGCLVLRVEHCPDEAARILIYRTYTKSLCEAERDGGNRSDLERTSAVLGENDAGHRFEKQGDRKTQGQDGWNNWESGGEAWI